MAWGKCIVGVRGEFEAVRSCGERRIEGRPAPQLKLLGIKIDQPNRIWCLITRDPLPLQAIMTYQQIQPPSPSPLPPSPLLLSPNGSEEDSDIDRLWEEWQQKDKAHKRRRYVREKNLREAYALQDKRDRWKAASARYDERHPEVKEKKRVRAAERRAAKKLAHRRWDPPKRRKASTAEEPLEIDEDGLRAGTTPLSEAPDDASKVREAAQSLLGLRARCGRTEVRDSWTALAPQYDNRRSATTIESRGGVGVLGPAAVVLGFAVK
ncbi:hypothetical protein C8R45DRAFT_931155 [Mycena sanguinolenta]|nr:hypothetical protein C8R45DRAFT_931155 [Mycena sanguinolenta]